MQTEVLIEAWDQRFSQLYIIKDLGLHIEDFLKERPLLKSCEDPKYVINLFYDYVLQNNLGMTYLESLQKQLDYYQKLLNRYKDYLGSPFDDCLLGVYGYTVREERTYLRSKVAHFKKAIKEYKQNHK